MVSHDLKTITAVMWRGILETEFFGAVKFAPYFGNPPRN
jgi:hypothetical protein